MQKSFLVVLNVLSLVVLVGVVSAYLFFTRQSESAHVHYHAGFYVYVNGQRQDFSDLQYMSFTPCGADDNRQLSPAELQLEKAHLHDGVGNVVHVHREGATWNDLLTNLNLDYDHSQPVIGYTETATVSNILSQPIENHQSLIIIIGNQSQAQTFLSERVTQAEISAVEQRSELCGAEE